jgi:hypothetical protein
MVEETQYQKKWHIMKRGCPWTSAVENIL